MLLCQWVLRPNGRTFDPYQVYCKFPTVFSLEIHHGGYFTRSPKRVYNDGKSSARPKQTDPNDNPSVSEPNKADGVVSDHSKQSDGSEESSDIDDSDDSDFDMEGENIIDDFEVNMEDFRRHTDANVEWVGCNEAKDEPVEQNEPCLGEEDLEDFGSGTDSDDPKCNRNRALKKLANQHKPVDEKFYSDNFFVGQSFGNKGLIKEMVTRISVDSRRDIYT
ncbi:Transposase, MuDR [Artemisia annua]|uniref:Transposase, MuDR n=1 Tax=Artemisia annua TaxID=35608 RepID=A0A2U1KYI2_ARTAN|nr:Transposase, MuDR [Artemisia annua]